jgi:SAM-dependent methyltransferase
MERLSPLGFTGSQFGVVDYDKFMKAMDLLRESLFDKGATLFTADMLITWNRNLSFLRDLFYLEMIKSNDTIGTEKSTVWRLYSLIFFAETATRVEGDFLEIGCHTGHTAAHVLQKVDISKLNKKYYLYDLFEWHEGDEHPRMLGHNNETMHENVRKRFQNYPFVQVIKGSVPQSFSEGFPEKIAFAHIDMNHAEPEAGALQRVLPRLSRGGIIVFDDYGWWAYSAQKMALDPVAQSHGLRILELPTGQGLLIKS